jgi:hypothetical protein
MMTLLIWMVATYTDFAAHPLIRKNSIVIKGKFAVQSK